MRQEDKEVDGPDLERAEERKRETELVEEKEDALYDLDGKPETTLDGKTSSAVIGAMRKILAGDRLVVNDLELDKRHLVALEALKTAVEGKDQELSQFVYAEDRRTLLEQALAVLQPELASIQGLGTEFEEMIAKVSNLREKLNVLEDSEEELVEGRAQDLVEDSSDTDDKPDDDEETRKKKAEARAARAEKKKKKAAEAPEPDASLTGPELPEAPKPPTTLGDMKDIEAAAAANTPRWRRPGG